MPKITNVKPLLKFDSSASYILLINPENIPHLVLIETGKYYTLTYNSSVLGETFLPYFKKLKRLKKKMIFLKIKSSLENAEQEFGKYLSADPKNITCFVPLKRTVLNESAATMIHELVPELYENQIVEAAYHINAEEHLDKKGDFKLSEYSKKMIFSYIQHLKDKDASRK